MLFKIKKYYKDNELRKYYIFSIKDNIYGGFKKSINKDQLEKEIGFPYPWKTYAQIPVQDFMYGAM